MSHDATTAGNTEIQYKIDLTNKAIEKGLEIVRKSSTPNGYLRLGVRGAGCSGFSYVIETTDIKFDKDKEFIFNDLKIIIDKKSLKILNNLKLDYETKLMSNGFKFCNENAIHECSCGKSFSI